MEQSSRRLVRVGANPTAKFQSKPYKMLIKMTSNKNIVVLGGYARSGKTTALQTLKNLGYEVFSTSDIVHQHTHQLVKMLSGELVETYCKGTEYQLISTSGLSANFDQRNLLIAVAEATRAFDPNFYARIVVEAVNNSQATNIAFETVGGPEWDFIEANLAVKPSGVYNIRRPQAELPGVDIRKLVPDASTIWNTGEVKAFKEQIKSIFSLEQAPDA